MVDFYEEWAAETLSYYKATGDESYSEAASELLALANLCMREGVTELIPISTSS